MTKIAIIGVGQLGSRHLQALNLINKKLDITVVDSSQESLDIARSRFEASVGSQKHDVVYQKSLQFSDPVNVAIIASTAKSRRSIVEALLENTKVNHLVLEKILFTASQDYSDVEKLLAPTSTKAWVNCCMRMMPFYNQFNQLFQNSPIHYRVTGSQYGLVTNAIHYLDHVVGLTGCEQFTIDTNYLDKQIIPSKRPGYYELTGTLIAKFANGSVAYINSSKEGTAPVQIEIYNHEQRIISRESEQRAWITSQQTDWLWQEQAAPIPFQSTMTADLVSSLLETNHSLLPDFKSSMATHLQLLEPLKAFLDANEIHHEVEFPFT